MSFFDSIGISTETYTKLLRKYEVLLVNKEALPIAFIPNESVTHFLFQNKVYPITFEDWSISYGKMCLWCSQIKSVDDLVAVLESKEGQYIKLPTHFNRYINTGDTITAIETQKKYKVIETYHNHQLCPPTFCIASFVFYCFSDNDKLFWISQDDLIYKETNSIVKIDRVPTPNIENNSYGLAGTYVNLFFFKEESSGLFGAKLKYSNIFHDLIYNVSGEDMEYGSDKLPNFYGYVQDGFASWICDNNIGIELTGNTGSIYDIKGFKLIKFNLSDEILSKSTNTLTTEYGNNFTNVPQKRLLRTEFKKALRVTARPIATDQHDMSEEEIIYYIGHGYGDALGY